LTLQKDNQSGSMENVDREIAWLQKTNRELEENLARFQSMVDNTPAGIVVEDQNRNIIIANQLFCEIFSITAKPEQLIGSDCSGAADAVKHLLDNPDYFTHRINDIISSQKTIIGEEVKFADGRVYERDYIPVFTAEKNFIGHMWQYRDISIRKKSEDNIIYQNKLLEALFKNSTDAILYFDQHNKIIDINKNFKDLFGHNLGEIKGRDVDDVLEAGKENSANREYTREVLSGQKIVDEGVRYTKCGQPVEVLIKGIPVHINGQFAGGFAIYTDITDRKRYESELQYLSLHDQLTGLYNRTYFEDELQRLENSREHPVTIISVDLDGLKLINDTVGHEQGDKLLIKCANILQKALRKSDILARVGGDEFVAILPRTDHRSGEEIASRIQTLVEKANLKEQERLPLSISLGYATAVKPGKSLQKVFKEADDLMYRAKLHKGVDARAQIIQSLLATLGERDYITEGHARRLETLCVFIGNKVGISKKQLSDLRLLAQVHDLGKVGTPDNILFKKGPLTEQEWQTMKQHSEKGYRIALSSVDLTGIADLILKHHEHWDGSGYPLGMSGEEIPIECRILALADAYDAMTNDRPYRKAMEKEEAVAELKNKAGSQFDPVLVQTFLSILEEKEDL